MSQYKSLPAIVSWGIWINHNKGIFEGKVTTPQAVASNIMAITAHFMAVERPQRVRDIWPETIDKSYPWGYFNGAAQGDPKRCGAGAILHLIEKHSFRLKWSLGKGTNNKAEPLAIFILITFAHEKGV
jgi:hypothetical protein